MHVVGSRGSALRTVIEHHHIRIAIRQLVHHRIVAADALWLMTRQRNREVHGQDGVGVDKQFVACLPVAAHHGFSELISRSVLGTEEAGSLIDSVCVDFCSGRNHAGRVPLHAQRRITCREFTRLNIGQVAIALIGIVPFLQLPVEEPCQRSLTVRIFG